MIQCSYTRLGLYLILVGLVALTLVLTNCGGGGGGNGDGDGGSSDTGDNVQQGVFLDSAVEKIDYQTATQSGETDADGTFNYMSGETVTFSIGDLAIGSAPGQDTVTPVDIVPGATDETDPTVTNITIFLLGLDEDGDPSNGILISDDIEDIVSEYDIDFDQTTEDFLADQNMQDLLNELNNAGVFTDSTPRSWPPAEDAQIHLAGTLADIGGGDNGSGGSNGDDTTYEPVPSLSEIPDGERIIFVKRFTVLNTALWELYSMNSSGDDVRRHSEITPDGFSISMPEIVRDGKTVTFSSNYKTWLSAFYNDIFLWDLTSDFVRRLSGDQRPNLQDNTTEVTVNVVYPPDMVISSSQIRISFKGCTDFVHPSPYTSTSKTLNVDRVVLNVPADENIWIKAEVSSGKGDVKSARIPKGSTEVIQLDLRNGTRQADFPGSSPDGNWVACAITDNNTNLECSKIAIYTRDGSILYEENVGGAIACGDSAPVFSPDGTKIAYCPGQQASTGLGLLSTSDPITPPAMLFTSSFINGYPISAFPTWSPDGNYIVFNIIYINGLAMSTNLYKIPSAGGTLEQLTFYEGNTIASKASYSPDGTKIAFTLLTSNNSDYFSIAEDYAADIYVIPSSGGSTTQITHDGISKDPSWGTVNK